MPLWPIEMPSDTEIVPNSIGNPSAPRTPLLRALGEPVERQVARRDLVPAAGDADLRLAPVVVAHAYRAQHAAGGGAFDAVGDDRAVWLAMHSGLLSTHVCEPTATVDAVTAAGKTLTFRLPRSAYLAVLFLLFCAAPLALSARRRRSRAARSGGRWRVGAAADPGARRGVHRPHGHLRLGRRAARARRVRRADAVLGRGARAVGDRAVGVRGARRRLGAPAVRAHERSGR